MGLALVVLLLIFAKGLETSRSPRLWKRHHLLLNRRIATQRSEHQAEGDREGSLKEDR